MNILCKLGIHKWNGLTFYGDKPFISRSCDRCDKLEDVNFWDLSTADKFDYVLWVCLPQGSYSVDIIRNHQ